jgi:large subunit ribosomal protein L24
MKVKKGDTVQVIAGKDKGARGKVIAAIPKQDRVIVEGVNRVKKHTRVSTNARGARTGGIVTQEAAIHVSNVMVIDSDGKPTRIGYRKDDVRISRSSGKDI